MRPVTWLFFIHEITVPISLSPQHRADDAWYCQTCVLLHSGWVGGSVYRPATFQGDAIRIDLYIASWLQCLGVWLDLSPDDLVTGLVTWWPCDWTYHPGREWISNTNVFLHAVSQSHYRLICKSALFSLEHTAQILAGFTASVLPTPSTCLAFLLLCSFTHAWPARPPLSLT